jgi:hypothetical protein
MPTTRLAVTSGPNKADLLRAAANPDENLHAIFGTPQGMVEARIDAIEEIGIDGVDFTLWGHLASSNLRGAVFTGTYNCEARTGRLALKTDSFAPH